MGIRFESSVGWEVWMVGTGRSLEIGYIVGRGVQTQPGHKMWDTA